MASKPSLTQAPKPIGVTDDCATSTSTTPVIPPASPTTSAVTAPDESTTKSKNNSCAPSPTHSGLTSDQVSPSPAIHISASGAESGAPRDHMPRQQQQRASAAHCNSVAGENSDHNACDSAAPSSVSSSHRPQHHNLTTAAVATVTAMTPATQNGVPSVLVQDGGFADGFTTTNVTTSTYSPQPVPTATSAVRNTLKAVAPRMNASLFTQGTPESMQSPLYGNSTDPLNDGSSAGYGSATSAATTISAPTTPSGPSRTNLIIYNIGNTVTEDTLHELFDVYGEVVSCAVMRNIHTGESQGTAFVRFATNAEARRALYAYNDRTKPLYLTESKPLVVQWARKQHDDTPVGEARKKIMKLFVRNIPLDCSVEVLEMLFGQYGNVRQVTLHKDTAPVEDAAMERLIAFVIYTEEGAAERAATAVHNTKPFPSCNGIPIMIKLAEDSQRRRFFRNADGKTTSVVHSPMSDTSNAFASMRTSAASLPAFGGNGNDSSADNSSTNNSTYGTPSSQAVYATAAAPSHLYPIPLVPDNYPSTYHVPSAESLQMYAQPEGNAGPLAADGYDAYSSQQYMSNGNGETTAAYYSYQNSSYESAASGFDPRHPVSYTQFPQHNRLLQHHAHYNYEDAGGVDSLARINAFHNGGYGAAGSPPYLQSHTENMPDACLTGYGTDQGSPSLKSMMSSREASAHGGGSAVCAASTDPRMSSSRSWFSANDCSANTSVQGSVSRSGCQPFMPGGHGGNYPNNGDTQLMAVVSPGNGLAEPQYVSSGHHDHSRSSLPAPAMGGCRYAGVERVAAAPHLFFSGGAHHSSSSNSSMATSPSGSPRKRYYNNPYCATSPKLYC